MTEEREEEDYHDRLRSARLNTRMFKGRCGSRGSSGATETETKTGDDDNDRERAPSYSIECLCVPSSGERTTTATTVTTTTSGSATTMMTRDRREEDDCPDRLPARRGLTLGCLRDAAGREGCRRDERDEDEDISISIGQFMHDGLRVSSLRVHFYEYRLC